MKAHDLRWINGEIKIFHLKDNVSIHYSNTCCVQNETKNPQHFAGGSLKTKPKNIILLEGSSGYYALCKTESEVIKSMVIYY